MIGAENVNLCSCENVNCYVIRGENGDMLIDTGSLKYRDYIETWLTHYNVKLIMLTHGHIDRSQNAKYFSELYNAPVIISRYDCNLVLDNMSRGCYYLNPVGKVMDMMLERRVHCADLPSRDKLLFAEEDSADDAVKALGIEGDIISLDGHTRGSIGFVHGTDLYCGDAAVNFRGHLCEMPMCESPKAAKRSFRRIFDLVPERIFCGHGDIYTTF